MGFDIQRFIDQNIDKDLICNICQDVLEDPVMITTCEHLYCSLCIRDCINARGVCPQDRTALSISKLSEPMRVVKNLLNKLKIKCDFDDCPQVFPLGELRHHLDKCDANPENQKIKCFCKNSFSSTELSAHKALCLEYQKNELSITRSQLSTYTSIIIEYNEVLSLRVGSDSEIKFLYKQLNQNFAKLNNDYNIIQKSLLYITSKLLIDENDSEKDMLTTIRYVKYAFEDLSLALDRNYDNCCHMISNNGIDYMILCQNSLNNKHINRFIANILKSLSQFEDLLVELFTNDCIKLMLNLMNESNDINASIEAATVLSDIILLGADRWTQHLPDQNRQTVLKEFVSHLSKWKFSPTIESKFDSFDDLFTKLASDSTPLEVVSFYIWLLANVIRIDPEKYFPLYESANGSALLKNIYECSSIEDQYKRYLELIFNKWMEWKERSQNSLPEVVV